MKFLPSGICICARLFVCLSIQEDICETIYTSLEQSCPALYLERAPLSVLDLRAALPVSRVHIYRPRTIILAQLGGMTSVGHGSEGSSQSTEQLSDLIAYGCDEVWSCLHPGVDQPVTGLSLYARYQLAELLDRKDWSALAKALGLEILDPEEESAGSVYSMTDGVLADWISTAGPAATIRALNTALQSLQRSDVIDALLSLTPLYHYVNKDNNNDLQRGDFVLQGHQGGSQRPLSSISSTASKQ